MISVCSFKNICYTSETEKNGYMAHHWQEISDLLSKQKTDNKSGRCSCKLNTEKGIGGPVFCPLYMTMSTVAHWHLLRGKHKILSNFKNQVLLKFRRETFKRVSSLAVTTCLRKQLLILWFLTKALDSRKWDVTAFLRLNTSESPYALWTSFLQSHPASKHYVHENVLSS